jgi:hypothetical protein
MHCLPVPCSHLAWPDPLALPAALQEEEELGQQLRLLVRHKGKHTAVVGTCWASSSEETKWQVLLAPGPSGNAAASVHLHSAALVGQPCLLQWIMVERLKAEVQAEQGGWLLAQGRDRPAQVVRRSPCC